MKVLNAKYDIHPRNYHNQTPPRLKKFADILILTIVAIDPVMTQLPDFEGKEWVVWGWSTFVVLFRIAVELVRKNGI